MGGLGLSKPFVQKFARGSPLGAKIVAFWTGPIARITLRGCAQPMGGFIRGWVLYGGGGGGGRLFEPQVYGPPPALLGDTL